jgi:hypothetical protein
MWIHKLPGFTSKAIQNENETKIEENQSVATPAISQGIAAAKDTFESVSTKTNDISSFLQPANLGIYQTFKKSTTSSFFESYGSQILGKAGITSPAKASGNNIEEISTYTGVPVQELQSIFAKNGLKPGELPYPPDERVVAFLKDPAFASMNEADLLWKIYSNFENVDQASNSNPIIDSKLNQMAPLFEALIPNVSSVRNAAEAQAKYEEIAAFAGKSPSQIEDLFTKYHLKPYSLPQPPDYNVLAFLKDPAFSGVSSSLLLYMTYNW